MPQKKPKKKSRDEQERKQITLRFDDNEMAALNTDRRELNSAGVPASFGAYAKHAVVSYPKLRKLEGLVRFYCESTPINPGLATDLLQEAGL